MINNDSKSTGMSPEEERKYWEERGPLAPGSRNKITPAKNKRERCSSFLTIRMTGEELTQLRDIANKMDMGPSTFVRQIIRNLLVTLDTEDPTLETTGIALNKVLEKLLDKSPELKRKSGISYSTGAVSDKEKRTQFLVMDAARTKPLEALGYEVLSALVETVNPSVTVITPADSRYEAVKMALGNPPENKETAIQR